MRIAKLQTRATHAAYESLAVLEELLHQGHKHALFHRKDATLVKRLRGGTRRLEVIPSAKRETGMQARRSVAPAEQRRFPLLYKAALR